MKDLENCQSQDLEPEITIVFKEPTGSWTLKSGQAHLVSTKENGVKLLDL